MTRIVKGRKVKYWEDSLPSSVTELSLFDRTVLILWTLSLLASLAALSYFIYASTFDKYVSVQVLAAPFILVGVYYMLDNFLRGNKAYLLFLVMVGIIVGVLIAIDVHSYGSVALFIAEIAVGSVGVAVVVASIQKLIFFRTLHSVRYMNIKAKRSLGDRVVSFMFNVPPDIDTRRIELTLSKSFKFPWKDMFTTAMLSMAVGLFVWIYFSMNPVASDDSITDASLSVFTVILYVPIITMTFSIYKTVDARVESDFEPYRLYNGVVATIQRMALPVLAVLLYVYYKIDNTDDYSSVLQFIIISAVVIFFVVMLTSAIYYRTLSDGVVADIEQKNKIFIPVSLFANLKNESRKDKKTVPGTPERDESDISKLDISYRSD